MTVVILLISICSLFIGVKLIRSGNKVLREEKLPDDILQRFQEFSFSYIILRSIFGDNKAIAYDRILSGCMCIIAPVIGVILVFVIVL